MSRILLPLAITASIVAQIPTADWKEISALGILGATLLWIITKTQPSMLKQVTDLTETFARTVQALQEKNTIATEKFTALTAETVANANSQHDHTIAVGVDLAKAIAETGQTLAKMQDFCRGRTLLDGNKGLPD